MKDYGQLEKEAADLLIEASRLRRENKRLRAAMQRIVAQAADIGNVARAVSSSRFER